MPRPAPPPTLPPVRSSSTPAWPTPWTETLTRLVDPISGTVTAATNELASEEQGFTDQITQLNALLDEKKAVYEEQFANMENALASLQSISSTLGSIGTVGATSSSKSSSSSSS